MRRWFSLFFLLFIFLKKAHFSSIQGCLSTSEFVLINEGNSKTVTENFCFCNRNERELYDIICLFGSNSNNLKQTIEAINSSNNTVETISIRNANVSDFILSDGMLSKLAPQLVEFEMSNCRGQTNLNDAFNDLQVLDSIFIENCNLEKIPTSISKLSGLKSLSLSDNKISNISKEDFSNNYMSLEYLNLAGNFISEMDKDSLSSLIRLETLKIGHHNHASKSLMDEISKMENLKAIDFAAIDGLSTINDKFFKKLTNLEELSLAGCSLNSINKTTFQNLPNLRILDLRVNLIENVSTGAFEELKNLTHLSLAGNYLKSFKSDMWSGLEKLKVLDLSFNELKMLNKSSFEKLGKSLKELNLAENKLLNKIDSDSLNGLIMLQKFNASSTSIKNIDSKIFAELASLESVDLSNCKIETIDKEAFSQQDFSLKKLYLNRNKITKLDSSIIEKMEALTDIDLSNNPWLCDKEIRNLKKAIEKKYETAIKFKVEFFLKQSNNTLCNRPYKLENKKIMELEVDKLEDYDSSKDFTTLPPETTTQNIDKITTEPFKIEDITIVTGNSSDELTRPITKDDDDKPIYNINSIIKDNQNTNSGVIPWQGLLIVIFAVATVAILGIIVVKKVRNDLKNQKIHPAVSPNTTTKTQHHPVNLREIDDSNDRRRDSTIQID
ncbi:Leucine-rich repeat and Leucine-rich repeat, typical subtype and Leucine rich repeat 4-containing protein [Strongyloides ratti]|uniref:Leucine-rich repeat and Leucine-rich repeat, typical subtype and Leucine rich repeat 4-containing protein n=1 Tax=Strongyloides ratti TaxID=34506 RepID=A0A090LG31_STRRB|nr:Leucine-rich repeat and Leucine-rich repeat, typical subtype and Leucine rich repeat 4-containing protein [Strongyloides ratti]CEF66480.1 Leucine-rich repeat and Leucine-rich repeat, typical subtype and Leucine rich repeat 4-containing protein [Strongyloides ratti]